MSRIAGIRPYRVAEGHHDSRGGGKKIAIRFDDETFAQVSGLAQRRDKSFASVIRELVEFGLLDIEEGRRDA